TRVTTHRLRRDSGRDSAMATVSPTFASWSSLCATNFDVFFWLLPYKPWRTWRSTETTTVFSILSLTTVPVTCDLTLILYPLPRISPAESSSRAPGRGARRAPSPAPRAAPSTSGCAAGTAGRRALFPVRAARRPTARESLPPSWLRLSASRLGRRLLAEARGELRLDRQLRRGQVHRLARLDLGHAFHLEHDASGPDDADPLLGRAFALAHARFQRLLRDRLVGEDAHPDLPAALDETGHRDARRFDLAVGDPGRLHRLHPVVAERHIRSAPRFAGHTPALLLAVLDLLRHQHRNRSLPFTLPGSRFSVRVHVRKRSIDARLPVSSARDPGIP